MTVFPESEIVVAQLNRVGFVVRDPGLLLSALARPETTLFGVDAYPSLALKIAALMDSIVNNHPMIDGNKRSSWLVANLLAEFNGYELVAVAEDAFAFVLEIATGGAELEPIALWIEEHLRPVPPR